MKITKEFRNLSSQELQSRLTESRKELLKLNALASTGNVSNPGKIKQVRKNIARILTLAHSTEVQKPR